jgi:signal transduction histidine kinase
MVSGCGEGAEVLAEARYDDERLLRERVEQRTRELSALLDVARSITSTLDLRDLLSLILDQLKTAADYDGAGIVVLRDRLLHVIGYRGPIPQEYALQASFPAEGALVWELLKRQEPVVIDDVRGDTPLARGWREAVGAELDTTYAFIRSWVAVPLTLQDRVIGGLTLENRRVAAYSEEHVSIAVAIAQQAAVAIENARLYEHAQRMAVFEERQRLARELHDSVSQALYSIALGARTARALLERDPARVAEPLDFVLAQAELGLTEMRALIFELRPEALEQDGLVTALERQADLLRARHGLVVELKLGAEPAVPVTVKEALYRVGQEAFHNVVKHARARRVALSLVSEEDALVLRIEDDGVGFAVDEAFPGHFGLRSMKERVAALDGVIRVESAPGRGTTVDVALTLSVNQVGVRQGAG